jgi:hypothetical protein
MLVLVVIVCRVGAAAGQPSVNGIVEDAVVVGEAIGVAGQLRVTVTTARPPVGTVDVLVVVVDRVGGGMGKLRMLGITIRQIVTTAIACPVKRVIRALAATYCRLYIEPASHVLSHANLLVLGDVV